MAALPYYNQGPGGPPRMRYWAAYRFLWSSPAGWRNLLFASVCMLIPVIGPLVLIGYLHDVLLARLDTLDDDRLGYPDFDFNRLADYLTRGVWPFLVSLVASLGFIPAFALAAVPGVLIPLLDVRGPAIVLLVGAAVLLFLAAVVLMNLLVIPLTLRAAILQEFGPAFSWPWIKDFAGRTWRETLLSTLFSSMTAIPLMLIGYAMCFVGLYAAMALMITAQWHLHFQLYRIYLSRGGRPVPPKPLPPPPIIGGIGPVPVIPDRAVPPPLPPWESR